MSTNESINTIYNVAKTKMNAGQAGNYVGEVVAFCINRLNESGTFSNDNLEMMLKQEAEFHLTYQSKDVA